MSELTEAQKERLHRAILFDTDLGEYPVYDAEETYATVARMLSEAWEEGYAAAASSWADPYGLATP